MTTTTAKTKRQRKDRRPKCCECGGIGELCTGADIFPHKPQLASLNFYRCDCGAHVGCRKNSVQPVGLCGNKATRAARSAAKARFERLWWAKSQMPGWTVTTARDAAYVWLAGQLGVDRDGLHIGHMDAAMARRVVDICEPYLDRIRRAA